jgi:hypothetical protein
MSILMAQTCKPSGYEYLMAQTRNHQNMSILMAQTRKPLEYEYSEPRIGKYSENLHITLNFNIL